VECADCRLRVHTADTEHRDKESRESTKTRAIHNRRGHVGIATGDIVATNHTST
jgi:hypothetical protein